ncbi:MAG: septal ring lytic transglycosylase RlpA family protein [Stellaceae bacterium]
MDTGGRSWAAGPLLLGLLLAGCASHPYVGSFASGEERGAYRVGVPYEIKGVWYYPAVDYNYDRTGVASWYGAEFEGRYTANGEIFDPNQLTAANTTLPMPSIVQVTNLQNGRSLQLRVNDRGPFVNGRLIDVSRRAAQLLGFKTRGTTPVEVKILRDASIEVAEEAMRNSGQVLVADAAAAAPTAAVGPPHAAYATAAPPRRAPAETAPRARARTALPPSSSQSSPPVAQVAMAPTAPPARTSDAPPPSTGAYAALSRFALIAPAEAAPLSRAPMPAPAPLRKTVAGPTRIPETPLSQSRVAADTSGSSGRLYIQAGAFSMRENARRVQSRIAPLGSVRVMTAAVNGIEVYRVRLGPVASKEQADRLLQSVVSSGYPAARIVTD